MSSSQKDLFSGEILAIGDKHSETGIASRTSLELFAEDNGRLYSSHFCWWNCHGFHTSPGVFWLKFHRCSVKAEHQDEGEAAEATETKERAGVLTRHMKVQPRNVKISPPNLQVLLTKLGVSVGNWTCWFTSKHGMKSFGDAIALPWDKTWRIEATRTGHMARNGPWDWEEERLQRYHFRRFHFISVHSRVIIPFYLTFFHEAKAGVLKPSMLMVSSISYILRSCNELPLLIVLVVPGYPRYDAFFLILSIRGSLPLMKNVVSSS